ncbi:RNA-binding protein [Methanobrevibacter sp. DSM 116169]|uniref:RNA-binding protein n=1 Tax=Methanobrevibacter sp. DSM 116169 TaxID=3242727 RepID=UPI0038FC3351
MIHNIRFRIFVYNNENEDDLSQALLNILPEAIIQKEDAEGIFEDDITILTGLVDKKRYTKEFFKSLKNLDKDQLNKLILDLDKKMDEHGNLFLRFDIEDAIDEKWTIVDSGNCIHLKVKIAAYPAKKEIAIKKIKEELD